MCEKAGQKVLVALRDALACGMLFDHAFDQVECHGLQKTLDALGAHAVIDVHDKGLVVAHREHDVFQAHLPGIGRLVVGERAAGVFLTCPFN